jgi:hypothetical protein
VTLFVYLTVVYGTATAANLRAAAG